MSEQVREELINMLKNKETEQSRELTALQQDLEHRMKIVDEVRGDFIYYYFMVLEDVFMNYELNAESIYSSYLCR